MLYRRSPNHKNNNEESTRRIHNGDSNDCSGFGDTNDDNNHPPARSSHRRSPPNKSSAPPAAAFRPLHNHTSPDSMAVMTNGLLRTWRRQQQPQSVSLSSSSFLWKISTLGCRCVLLELPLWILLSTCGILCGFQSLYQTYYIPLMDRSTRTTVDLQDEFTYYHRRCTVWDVTTRNLTDLMVPSPLYPPPLPPSISPTTSTTSTKQQSRVKKDHDSPINDDKVVPTTPKTVVNVDRALDILMTHGALLIPNILSPETVAQLREYAVYRNQVIPDHEQYPVSQGKNRISFGYDATEHPAVVRAVREVTHHPFLQQLLLQVLGDADPASTEITTITQYYKAPPQVWHSDTKQDGNALKYARTYSHSYSLFLPLQNTTRAMGPTEICPGTQYCGNSMEGVCDPIMRGNGLQAAYPDQVFPAGDGALLNQHVWHRGAPHNDPHSSERILFVMSFIARPLVVAGDARQLSRGTYFHQKWNMWGHTWSDLMDPLRFMVAPWSYLKCLALWSTNGGNTDAATSPWGYDLVTATYMRFSNDQLGDGLDRFIEMWDHVLQIPTWLHGRYAEEDDDDDVMDVVSQKQAWTTFIAETMIILNTVVGQITMGVHVLLYSLWAMLLWMGWWWRRRLVVIAQNDGELQPRSPSLIQMLRTFLLQLLFRFTIVLVAVLIILFQIRQSAWGRDTLRGKILMRPFPPPSSSMIGSGGAAAAATFEETFHGIVSVGPTTFPSAVDILIGTRLDAPWLGIYEKWLDGHAGNRHFQTILEAWAPSYQAAITTFRSSSSSSSRKQQRQDVATTWLLPTATSPSATPFTAQKATTTTLSSSSLADEIVAKVVKESIQGGTVRFLQQDYRTGDWRVLSTNEIPRLVRLELVCAVSPLLSYLRTMLERSMALYRFGTLLRSTALARRAAVYAGQWRQRLVATVTTTTGRGVANDPNDDGAAAAAAAILPRSRPLYAWPSLISTKKRTGPDHHSTSTHYLLQAHFPIVPIYHYRSQPVSPSRSWRLGRYSLGLMDNDDDAWFRVGQPVWVNLPPHDEDLDEDEEEEASWHRGDITFINPGTRYATVALETGEVEGPISPTLLAPYQPVQEGTVVRGCFSAHHYRGYRYDDAPPPLLEDCYNGHVVRVRPDGSVAIQYDDGDYDARKPPGQYYIPPYAYSLPDGY